MTDRLDLSERHRRRIETLLREYLPGVEVWAYGSRVSGRSHDGSDLDLVLRGPGLKEIPVGQLADFAEAIQESTIPFLVEARDWAKIPERFHREIEQNQVVLVESQDLGKSWPMVRLGDHVDSCLGKMLDKKKNRGELFPYLGNKNVRWGFFDTRELSQMRFEHHEHDRYGLKYGDLVVCEGGEPGRCAIWKDEMPGMKIQKALHRIRTRGELDNRFLHYWFRLAAQYGVLEPYFTGTTIKHLTGKAIDELRIPLPPKSEQHTIAKILGSLDDKIELNRRMNETLEAMARAIFKDWFVDFGPTRAKVGRRDPYLSSEFWDLFPDSLGGNGLPKGWNSGILADIAESPNHSVSPTDVQQETPYIGLEHMPRRSISLGEWGCAGTVTSNKLIFKKGEILFGKLRPYFHKVGRAPVDGICSTDIVVVKPKGLSWDALTLQYLSSDEFVNYTSQVSTGTKMPRTSWKLMRQYQITQPPEQIANSFQTLVNPMISMMDRNSTGTRYLATIRDILLPKLMSREIRIHDAVKIADTAVS